MWPDDLNCLYLDQAFSRPYVGLQLNQDHSKEGDAPANATKPHTWSAMSTGIFKCRTVETTDSMVMRAVVPKRCICGSGLGAQHKEKGLEVRMWPAESNLPNNLLQGYPQPSCLYTDESELVCPKGQRLGRCLA